MPIISILKTIIEFIVQFDPQMIKKAETQRLLWEENRKLLQKFFVNDLKLIPEKFVPIIDKMIKVVNVFVIFSNNMSDAKIQKTLLIELVKTFEDFDFDFGIDTQFLQGIFQLLEGNFD